MEWTYIDLTVFSIYNQRDNHAITPSGWRVIDRHCFNT